ncbi:MAG: aminotransferase class IV [Phycisphaerales bacterium]|nr:aminotransferase class IV [Phycisphaerales bacterium]
MIIHLNGGLVPAEQAAISPLDRGFVFGEGVYEGLRSFRGRVVGSAHHAERMRRGLQECRIDWDPGQLEEMTRDLLAACGLPDAFIYWQVTRGAPAPGQPMRSRVPAGAMKPTVLGFCTPQPALEQYRVPQAISAAVRPDTRWTRGSLKSTSMLGNVLASLEAYEDGAQDALLVRDGLVGEGTCANVVLALPRSDGTTELATPSLDSAPILPGVTRALLLDWVPEMVSRPVRVEELARASEVMLIGSTAMVTSITRLDGRPVGSGTPGPAAHSLLESLIDAIRADLGLGAAEPPAAVILKTCVKSQAVA